MWKVRPQFVAQLAERKYPTILRGLDCVLRTMIHSQAHNSGTPSHKRSCAKSPQ
jgi:hypothetical protein